MLFLTVRRYKRQSNRTPKGAGVMPDEDNQFLERNMKQGTDEKNRTRTQMRTLPSSFVLRCARGVSLGISEFALCGPLIPHFGV